MLRQLYRLLIDLFSRARRQRRQAARARHERRERERRRYLHLLHDVAAQHREIVALKQQRKRECQAARRRLARPSRN